MVKDNERVYEVEQCRQRHSYKHNVLMVMTPENAKPYSHYGSCGWCVDIIETAIREHKLVVMTFNVWKDGTVNVHGDAIAIVDDVPPSNILYRATVPTGGDTSI